MIEKARETKQSSNSLYWDFIDSGRISSTAFQKFKKYKEIYRNIDKYPRMEAKRVLVLDQKDESTNHLETLEKIYGK